MQPPPEVGPTWAAQEPTWTAPSAAAAPLEWARPQRHDRVDLDLRPARQPRHADRDPRRGVGRKVLGAHLVHFGELPQVGHVDRDPHRLLERGAGRGAHRAQVLQAAARLLARAHSHQLAAHRVERDLPGAEQQLAGRPHRVAVGADRGGRFRSRHGLARMSHTPQTLHPQKLYASAQAPPVRAHGLRGATDDRPGTGHAHHVPCAATGAPPCPIR